MKNSNKDLYNHLGWAVDLLDSISDKFSSNKDIPKQVFLEMERIKKDLCTRQKKITHWNNGIILVFWRRIWWHISMSYISS